METRLKELVALPKVAKVGPTASNATIVDKLDRLREIVLTGTNNRPNQVKGTPLIDKTDPNSLCPSISPNYLRGCHSLLHQVFNSQTSPISDHKARDQCNLVHLNNNNTCQEIIGPATMKEEKEKHKGMLMP